MCIEKILGERWWIMKNRSKKLLQKKKREVIKELLKKNLKNLNRLPERTPVPQSKTIA